MKFLCRRRRNHTKNPHGLDFERTSQARIGFCGRRARLLSICDTQKELAKLGLEPGRDGNLKLVRPSDLMIVSPIIASVFDRGKLACGDNQYFRWCTNNVKITMDKRGNEVYEKIEPKSRKTDAFMAYAAAMTMQELLPEDSTEEELDEINPIFY